MYANGYGRVICMGPPIPTGHDNAYRAYAGKTAYYMSKARFPYTGPHTTAIAW